MPWQRKTCTGAPAPANIWRVSSSASDGASVVTHYRLTPGNEDAFARTQGEISRSLADSPDYDGSESYADPSGSQQTVVRRFRTPDAAHAWVASPSRSAFDDSLSGLCSEQSITNILLPVAGSETAGASFVSTTRVKTGQDAWFAEWQGRMGAAQQQFPGYVGQRVQAPIPGVNPDWVAIVAFDTADNLRGWHDSPERKALIDESTPYVERFDVRPASSAFESWFAGSERGVKPPPSWKLSAIVLLVLYPVVMLEMFTLNKFTADMHVEAALAVFIGNLVSVALTGFLLIPWASRALNWWLVPPEGIAAKRTAIGAALVVALYAVCIVIFALLLAWDPGLMK